MRPFGATTHRLLCLSLLTTLLLLAGCGGHRSTHARVPPAPAITPHGQQKPGNTETQTEAKAEQPDQPPEPSVSKNAKVIFVETGMASWYGPSFNKRRGANGEIYDQDQLTAAHRTIPLNSIARVTNVSTGESVVVRITDRGPFVADRVIDLSKAAAQRVGVYIHGTAKVKIEVLQAPSDIKDGGRWAVQIGAFDDEDSATKVKSRLARRYRTAKVIDFSGPHSDWWVRVRVLNDDKKRAEEVAHNNSTPQGSIFLVRLD